MASWLVVAGFATTDEVTPPASIPSVYSTLREDVYVILTAIEADGSATIKLYRNPLVNWIWVGTTVLLFGGIVCIGTRRKEREEAHG